MKSTPFPEDFTTAKVSAIDQKERSVGSTPTGGVGGEAAVSQSSVIAAGWPQGKTVATNANGKPGTKGKVVRSSIRRSIIPAHQFTAQMREELLSFRIKRDLWIRELQEVFNKIYGNFVKTLEEIKAATVHSDQQTNAQKITLKKKLRGQMKEIAKIASSLSDSGDDFVRMQENMPIAHYYKGNIMEMHKLLSILLKLQIERKHIDGIKMNTKFENKCAGPLTEEIKKSYLRVQRLKAGNKLGKVIQDQVQEFARNKPAEGEQQLLQPQPKEETQLHFERQNEVVENEDCGEGVYVDIEQQLSLFKRKKQELEQMIQTFIADVNNPEFNFDNKYRNFKEYFSRRNELMGMYLGENQLHDFLEESTKQRQKEPIKIVEREETDEAEYEHLYKDLDPINFQVSGDRNIEALQRIIKINEEIRRTLIEDEHSSKMQDLQRINVEQNQQFWTSVFEKKPQPQVVQNQSLSPASARDQKPASAAGTQRTLKAESHKDIHMIKRNEEEVRREETKVMHQYIHRHIDKDSHPSNPSLRPFNANQRVSPSDIKFLPLMTPQSNLVENRIVSSNLFLEKSYNRQAKIQPRTSSSSSSQFRKTFQQSSTLYRSGFFPTDVAAEVAQNDNSLTNTTTTQQQTVILPKSVSQDGRGKYLFPRASEKLSFEEEMRRISCSTKQEMPMYLNKFNSHNFYSRALTTPQGGTRTKQKLAMTATTTTITSMKKARDQGGQSYAVISPHNQTAMAANMNLTAMSFLPNKQEILSGDETVKKQNEKQHETSLANKKQQQKKEITSQKTYLRDEISAMFKVSQRDLLFKINGNNWQMKP